MNEGDEYKTQRAPLNRDLPVIMTMCTPEERVKVIEAVKSRIVAGQWIGYKLKGYGQQWRPVYDTHTVFSDSQVASGERSKKKRKTPEKRSKDRGMVRFSASHAILLAAGHYPTEECNVASHLCHVPSCLLVEHLVWESAGHNFRRERLCHKNKVCQCRLTSGCIFNSPHHLV